VAVEDVDVVQALSFIVVSESMTSVRNGSSAGLPCSVHQASNISVARAAP